MKTITKFLLALTPAILLSATVAQAQCVAGYTWTQTSNNVIAFTNTSSPINPNNTFFSWSFGDQQYDWQQNPIHTYNVPGTYIACVTMYDSLNFLCSSTFCDTITVTGTVICNLTVSANLSTSASCITCSDGEAYAAVSGGTAPYTYSWSNSATTQIASGLAVGSYTVCVTDANGCNACSTVNVVVNACTAGFTWAQTSNNVIAFTNTSTPIIPSSTIFSWDFGDQQYDWQQDPIHIYSAPGNYMVCVTMSDSLNNSNSCTSTFCDSITVTGTVLCNVYLYSGVSIPASCSTCADGSAYASMTGGTAPYTYLWSDGQTTQVATGLAPGTYGVCVTDANGCQACDSLSMYFGNLNTACNANFIIYPDSVNTFQAWIYNLSTGGPNMQYYWIWGDNTYDTIAFPSHIYANSGSYTICLVIYDSINQCADSMCQLLWVPRLSQQAASNPYYVNVLPNPTGIQEQQQANWSLFPNPASTEIRIKTEYSLQGNKYRILDIAGRIVIANTIDGNSINVNSLDNGMYILQIENSKGGFSAQRFMKD